MLSRQTLVLGTVLAALSAVPGCGRAPSNMTPLPVPQPATPATTPVMTPVETGHPRPAALTLQVYQEDTTTGVAAQIDRVDDTGTTHFFADVGDSGVATLTRPCSAGDRFAASPKIPAFLRVAPKVCATTITFRLYSAKATLELIRLADNASNAGDLANAQAYYGLSAERLRIANPQEAERLQGLANAAAARVLGVENAGTAIPDQGAATKEFTRKIKLYQHAGNLAETGVLDTATQVKLARTPPEERVRSVVKHAATAAGPVPPVANLTSGVNLTVIRQVPLSAAAAAHAAEIRASLTAP
jgi:hypothetical protein